MNIVSVDLQYFWNFRSLGSFCCFGCLHAKPGRLRYILSTLAFGKLQVLDEVLYQPPDTKKVATDKEKETADFLSALLGQACVLV